MPVRRKMLPSVNFFQSILVLLLLIKLPIDYIYIVPAVPRKQSLSFFGSCTKQERRSNNGDLLPVAFLAFRGHYRLPTKPPRKHRPLPFWKRAVQDRSVCEKPACSDVELEMHDVAVLHHVVLALLAQPSGVAAPGLSAQLHVILVAGGLRLDEAALKV